MCKYIKMEIHPKHIDQKKIWTIIYIELVWEKKEEEEE